MSNVGEAIDRSNEMIAAIRRGQVALIILDGLGLKGYWFIHPGSITLEPPVDVNVADLIGRLPAGWEFRRTVEFDDGGYGLFWRIDPALDFGLYLPGVPDGYPRPEEG